MSKQEIKPHTDDSEESAGEALAIEVEGLTFRYADGTTAVDGITFSIPKGEFFGFLGPNGAGKTTTIKILATLLEPTKGSVRVNGYDPTEQRTAVRGSIGYMAQSVSVDEELTARENLRFACEAYGVPAAHRDDRIEDLLALADLADVADSPAEQFSGGMQKRLDAATALVHDPELVFLDEPTTGLDPKARNRLWDYFRRINEQGTTVFLTTQYLEEADSLCDRLSVIKDGELVEDGSPESLKRRVGGQVLRIDLDGDESALADAASVTRKCDELTEEATVEVGSESLRVTTQHANELGTELLVELRDAGHTVTGFDIEEATLDDVFLAIADEEVRDLEAETEPMEASR
ncbi:ATP-binding cassette domain-containing protein [Haloarcula sp. JP-L23]|uniref:ABC transporter ATP-binding protein n=1 Tax=Haloarcula sp. JP-L23 TaxID=2716717 RepID=UPI00140ED9A4|nr:ATP-binding cassette domain-containing protein [Haloarcula sp. JP-L23]